MILPQVSQKRKYIPLSSLAGVPLIVPSRKSRIQSLRKWFGEVGCELNILCEMSNFVDAIALTERGVGISIVPRTVAAPSPQVVSKVIVRPSRRAEYVLVWNRAQPLTDLASAFVEYVSDWLETEQVVL